MNLPHFPAPNSELVFLVVCRFSVGTSKPNNAGFLCIFIAVSTINFHLKRCEGPGKKVGMKISIIILRRGKGGN